MTKFPTIEHARKAAIKGKLKPSYIYIQQTGKLLFYGGITANEPDFLYASYNRVRNVIGKDHIGHFTTPLCGRHLAMVRTSHPIRLAEDNTLEEYRMPKDQWRQIETGHYCQSCINILKKHYRLLDNN